MPRPNIVLCSKPEIEFLGERSLIPCINIFLIILPVIREDTVPIIPPLQAALEGIEGLSWWNRRIILVA